jgi:ribosomal protein S12 methylthiotransferase accessory factor
LYERIERDATMLAWYSTYEPLELTVDDETFQTLARRARSEDLTVTPLLVTQDVDVPVVAVAVTREEWPAFAIGSAAHLDPTEAATGALAEALQNWMELRGMGPDEAESADGAIGYYALFPEAAREFVDVEQSLPAANVGPETVPDGVAHVDALVERLSDVGLTAYGARVTPRDVEALGFEVVRTIVPQAQPLFLDDPFFGDRATTVPEGMGFEPRTDRDQHPFP